jgi:hypothetical protein
MDPNFERTVEDCLRAANRPPPPPKITNTREELAAMPVKELKKILQDRGVPFGDCTEKPELVQRILDRCT